MSRDIELGRKVGPLTVNLYRDSAFTEFFFQDAMVTAELRFPLMVDTDPWVAMVMGTENEGRPTKRAEWSIEAERTNAIPNGAWVEWWVNGECIDSGRVRRRGDLTDGDNE